VIPDELPREMEDLVADLEDLPQDVALRKAYDVIATKFPGRRFTSYLLFWRLFVKNPYRIWGTYQQVPCTIMNWLVMVILVKSGHFTEDEFSFKWTLVWGTPHQYLRVHLGDHTVDLDPFCAAFGVPYGEHARGMT